MTTATAFATEIETLDATAKHYMGLAIMKAASAYLLSEGIIVKGLHTGMGEIERVIAVKFAN